MPRPKGSKKEKNLLTTTTTSSSSRTSISSPLQNSNDFLNDDINWIKSSINNNKGGRPKKIEFINGTDDNLITTNSPTSSSSEISGGRVVVNPAVLRYLEQNRNTNKSNHENEELFNRITPMDITEGKDDNSFDDLIKSFAMQESIITNDSSLSPMICKSSYERRVSLNELIQLDKLIQDDLFWDFCTCSTDFLTSARLAEWILTHQQSATLLN